MSILFLDDDPTRHARIQPFIGDYVAAFTATQAIASLTSGPFDCVFLDHDLGGEQIVDSHGQKETGYTVARWIAENGPTIGLVVVHSLNPDGAKNIATVLMGRGYSVVVEPFYRLTNAAHPVWDPELRGRVPTSLRVGEST